MGNARIEPTVIRRNEFATTSPRKHRKHRKAGPGHSSEGATPLQDISNIPLLPRPSSTGATPPQKARRSLLRSASPPHMISNFPQTLIVESELRYLSEQRCSDSPTREQSPFANDGPSAKNPPVSRCLEEQEFVSDILPSSTPPPVEQVQGAQHRLKTPPHSEPHAEVPRHSPTPPSLAYWRRTPVEGFDSISHAPSSRSKRKCRGYPSPPESDRVNCSSAESHTTRELNSEKSSHVLLRQASLSTPPFGQPSGSRPNVSRSNSSTVFTEEPQLYRPLLLHESEFRLIKILPERKTRIQCEILHASLQDPPPYVAISYAWGDPRETRKIEIEGTLVHVCVSIYGALEVLRQKTDAVLVWADALSIDQKNRDERTQQVQLMTSIYAKADSVAIWLGPEQNDSGLAVRFLRALAKVAHSSQNVSQLITSCTKGELIAVVSLFKRDYWKRLWVVQEIVNARSISVFCGNTEVPWDVYRLAPHTLGRHRDELEQYFRATLQDEKRHAVSLDFSSHTQVLVHDGPGSIPDIKPSVRTEVSLLKTLRICRRKLTSDPRDKLFGVLGVLPEEERKAFRADYSLSVKHVYTEIVDTLIRTTDSLDVICDAIHFPVHISSANLPSFVPDWSQVPLVAALGHKYNFSASGTTKAISLNCKFLDERLNKLEISAVYLDTIRVHGNPVGNVCTLADYLMAFLHWRALLIHSLEGETEEHSLEVQENFCRTLSLGQEHQEYDSSKQEWLRVCYALFASLLHERLPYLALDEELREYVHAKVYISPESRREFLQKHFGDKMMGRCFCLTEEGRLGMGSGAMMPGDIVVVPLGCSTPILLRQECDEYRFVGDVYIHGYMSGEAVTEWLQWRRKGGKYVLH